MTTAIKKGARGILGKKRRPVMSTRRIRPKYLGEPWRPVLRLFVRNER